MSDHIEVEDGRIWKVNTATVQELYESVAVALHQQRSDLTELAIWFVDKSLCPGGLAYVRLQELSAVHRRAFWSAVETACQEAELAGRPMTTWKRLLGMKPSSGDIDTDEDEEYQLSPLVHGKGRCIDLLETWASRRRSS
jgi:hypothetical protein